MKPAPPVMKIRLFSIIVVAAFERTSNPGERSFCLSSADAAEDGAPMCRSLASDLWSRRALTVCVGNHRRWICEQSLKRAQPPEIRLADLRRLPPVDRLAELVPLEIESDRRSRQVGGVTVPRPGRPFVKSIPMNDGQASTRDAEHGPRAPRVVLLHLLVVDTAVISPDAEVATQTRPAGLRVVVVATRNIDQWTMAVVDVNQINEGLNGVGLVVVLVEVARLSGTGTGKVPHNKWLVPGWHVTQGVRHDLQDALVKRQRDHFRDRDHRILDGDHLLGRFQFLIRDAFQRGALLVLNRIGIAGIDPEGTEQAVRRTKEPINGIAGDEIRYHGESAAAQLLRVPPFFGGHREKACARAKRCPFTPARHVTGIEETGSASRAVEVWVRPDHPEEGPGSSDRASRRGSDCHLCELTSRALRQTVGRLFMTVVARPRARFDEPAAPTAPPGLIRSPRSQRSFDPSSARDKSGG